MTTDKERLDFLQKLTDKAEKTGKVKLSVGWGWRLHETTDERAVKSVRDAIDDFMNREDVEWFIS